MLIMSTQGAIGILDKTDMDHFADIFVAYQKLGKSNDPAGSFKRSDQVGLVNVTRHQK